MNTKEYKRIRAQKRMLKIIIVDALNNISGRTMRRDELVGLLVKKVHSHQNDWQEALNEFISTCDEEAISSYARYYYHDKFDELFAKGHHLVNDYKEALEYIVSTIRLSKDKFKDNLITNGKTIRNHFNKGGR